MHGNRKEAEYWAVISAENGDVSGQYLAGFILKDAPDTRDRRRARYWLRRAAEQGNDHARSALRELGEK